MNTEKIASSDIRELAIYFGDLPKDAPAWNEEVSKVYANEVNLRLKYNQFTLEKERVRDEKNEELKSYEEKEFDIEFECQFLTQFIGEKIDSKEIYLALIYWWRAINGQLPKTLLEKNEELIWGSKNYSKNVVTSDINIEVTTDAINDGSNRIAAFTKFKVGVKINNSKLSLELFTNIFTIFSVLGGLGRYSQRGNGAFEIIGSSINTLEKVNTVLGSIHFRTIEKKKIVSVGQRMNDYPYVKEISIGSPNASIIKTIKLTERESRFDCYHSRKILRNGHTPNYVHIKSHSRIQDIMSSVHVGVIRTQSGLRPVITLMNSTGEMDYKLIRDFIYKIT
jgi:hypothetical protein